jgi:4-alpha-glucanotransferase
MHLARLCTRWGVEPVRIDADGAHIARPEALVAVLGALGAPIARVDDAAEALRAPVSSTHTVVAWDGHLDRDRGSVALEGGGSTDTGELPFGIHRLERDGRFVISAPVKAPRRPTERVWGIFAPAHALHDEGTWGCGDLACLDRLADLAHAVGCHTVATLPLMAALDGEQSPYSPSSRLLFDDAYLDMSTLAARPAAVDELRSLAQVDRDAVRRAKRAALAPLARTMLITRAEEVDEWLRRTPHARPFAKHHGDEDLHIALQFWMHEQLTGLAASLDSRGQELYLDLPLGVHPDGYDAMAFRESFVEGVSMGAPPDELFRSGQDWGFAPLHPHRSADGGHSYLRQSVAAQLRYAHRLRFDHVLGVARQLWVPRGMTAADGVYVRYPMEEWLAALCLEAHRAGAQIVGEDLGNADERLADALAEHDLAGMWLGVAEHPPSVPAPGSVASWGTHDTATAVGWARGVDLAEQVAVGLAQAASLPQRRRARSQSVARWEAVLEGAPPWQWLAGSQAALVLVSLEDLWGEPRAQNLPGTWRERVNWRQRCAVGLPQLRPHLSSLRAVDSARRAR